MNKKLVLRIILDLIFLVVFNAVFFIAGGVEHTASVWVAYAFIHLAYIMVVVTPFLTVKSSAAVLGLSLYGISSAYFLIELLVGIIFILIASPSYKTSLIVQLVIAGLYAIFLVACLISNEQTADSTKRHEMENARIKTAAARVGALIGKVNDKKTDRAIEQAYDMLHSSPAKTIEAVSQIEVHIMDKISQLESVVTAQDLTAIVAISGEIVTLAEERNRTLRISY